MTSPRYDWFGVLAGRYATEAAMKKHVAHLVQLDPEGYIDWSAKTLCRKLPAERMSDMPADPTTPRCPTCVERFAKLISPKKRSTAKRSKTKRTTQKRRLLRRLQHVRHVAHRRGWGVLRAAPKFKVGDSVHLKRDPTHNWHVREVITQSGRPTMYRIYGIYDTLIVPESALTRPVRL